MCALVMLQTAPQPSITLREARLLVDPAVRWQQPVIKTEENGWDLMNKAIKLVPKPSVAADAEPEDPSALAVLLNKPGEPNIVNRCQKMLKTYEPALKTIKEAAAKPFWYAPAMPDDQVPKPFAAAKVDAFPMLAGLKTLGKALMLSASLNVKLGESAKAVDDLLLIHQIADRTLESHKDLMTALVGYAVESMANRQIQTLSADPALKAQDLVRVLQNYHERRMGIDLAEALKAEHDRMFVSTVAGVQYPSKEIAFNYGEEDDIASKVLDGHPNPFDRKETIALGSSLFKKIIEQTTKPEDEREVLLNLGDDLLKGWPEDLLDKGDEQGAAARKERLTPAMIDKYKAALRKIDNPIGKVLIAIMLPTFSQADEADLRAVASSRATRIILAIQIYEKQNGKALDSLETLASTGILKPVPVDPYNSKPFGYDAKRKVLWSVGPDLADDGGKSKVGASNAEDMVWPTDGNFKRPN